MSSTQQDRGAEHTLSVEEAIEEAMNTTQGPQSSPAGRLPEPHLPLRKASAQKLRSKHTPKPLFAPSQHHQLRGFKPSSPVGPLPHIDAVTASSEHAYAGRDVRRPSKLPLGTSVLRNSREQQRSPGRHLSASPVELESGRPTASPPPLPTPLMSPRAKQKGAHGEGLLGLRQRLFSNNSTPKDGSHTPDSAPTRPSSGHDDVRQSFRSATTTESSHLNASSVLTDRSSLATGHSSNSEYVQAYQYWPEAEETEGSITNDDVIGLYADGFESGKQSMDTQHTRSTRAPERLSLQQRKSLQVERPTSQPSSSSKPKRPNPMHRRSQSTGLLDQWKASPEVRLVTPAISPPHQIPAEISRSEDAQPNPDQQPLSIIPVAVPRDRYGFKKISQYVTVKAYDEWDAQYGEHLARRSKKWYALMKSYGLGTETPIRFPPKSDKIKRYVRKGIPPELRGAAWFWYAGGPSRLAKTPGLYWDLLEQVENGKLSDNDREHIERDLNRTFPDNIRFKPDPATTSDVQAGAGGGNRRHTLAPPETALVRSLRRVLQAFAVRNPHIGYCQSLNFIAGLLLLFLDEDEEKSFILLEIVTSEHLPGTHGVALEGANIDIAVLMACIKDSLPLIWAKLDDQGGGPAGDPSAQALRLPTVSLATTAWFMSLFVGTLPIESVLRVWDCLFFEGSKTLFRIALAIFKAGEAQILAVSDPMEIFQVVQTIPRSMLDVNRLMEVCFKRRGGFGHISQELIDLRRKERRQKVRDGGTLLGVEEGGGSRWKGRWRTKAKG